MVRDNWGEVYCISFSLSLQCYGRPYEQPFQSLPQPRPLHCITRGESHDYHVTRVMDHMISFNRLQPPLLSIHSPLSYRLVVWYMYYTHCLVVFVTYGTVWYIVWYCLVGPQMHNGPGGQDFSGLMLDMDLTSFDNFPPGQ